MRLTKSRPHKEPTNLSNVPERNALLEIRLAICAALVLIFVCYTASPRAQTLRAVSATKNHAAREAYVRRLPIPDSEGVIGAPDDGIVALPSRHADAGLKHSNLN